jgi:hypothetical protein
MRFKLFKYICIIVFIAILVLFTVGYSSQPILTLTATASLNVPNVNENIPALPNNGNYKYSLYMDKIVNNIDNSTINYKDINSTLGTISNIIKFVFIAVSGCIGLVILLSFIGLKVISYIPLLIALITMIILSIIIVIIYSTSFLIDSIKNYISSQTKFININNAKINYDNGGHFITASTIALLINYFLYMMLG